MDSITLVHRKSFRRLLSCREKFPWWWQPLTPLQLRLSLRRLLHGSCHPYRLFAWLVQPIPWHFAVAKDQMTPAELKQNPPKFIDRQDGIMQLRSMPLFIKRDTPLCSIYRIYEYICSNNYGQVQYETEYFYFHPDTARWSLDQIPDPKDKHEQRYAILGSIVEALAVAFNWRLSLGLQRDHSHRTFDEMEANPPITIEAPSWAIAVPPLQEPLVLAECKWHRKTPFEARNILGVSNGYMFSI